MRKRLASFLLCFFMCLALLPVSVQATETTAASAPEIPTEGDVWDGGITQPTKLVQLDGVYYYEITKCSELAYVAQTGGDWLGYNYILGNDLILNDVELTWDKDGTCTSNANALLEWIPIDGFTGEFNGNNYSISGLYIHQSSSNRVGLFGTLDGNVRNLQVVNAYINGCNNVGMIAGFLGSTSWIRIVGCRTSGLVKGAGQVGGVVGETGLVLLDDLINYSHVIGNGSYVGGIAGYGFINNLTNCINYGEVTNSGKYTAGIAAYSHFYTVGNCYNAGNISGTDYVGGVLAEARGTDVTKCCNTGTVRGATSVGGLIGTSSVFGSNPVINNSYNLGTIEGDSETGGIAGTAVYLGIQNTYSAGTVSGIDCTGGIVGNSDHIWGRSALSHNYYIANDSYFGCGNLFEDTAEQFEAKTVTELQSKDSYFDWDFNNVWNISPTLNKGYPYLQWQESSLSNIPVNGVSVNDAMMRISVGDYIYLTATVSPVNASNQSVIWSSSNSDIVTISAAGKVTATSVGTAVITATTVDGGYTASCAVTVTARSVEEYRINSITVRDDAGTMLSEIPNGSSLATVSITNLASEGNTLVFLAAYTSTGQYQGMIWVSVEDLPIGATIKVTLPVDNTDGKITDLKAFTIASFSNLTPLGEAVSFLP